MTKILNGVQTVQLLTQTVFQLNHLDTGAVMLKP